MASGKKQRLPKRAQREQVRALYADAPIDNTLAGLTHHRCRRRLHWTFLPVVLVHFHNRMWGCISAWLCLFLIRSVGRPNLHPSRIVHYLQACYSKVGYPRDTLARKETFATASFTLDDNSNGPG
jgi:hypothetical protein